MELYFFITITIQALIFLYVFTRMQKKDEQDQNVSKDIISSYQGTINEVTVTFIQEISKVQQKHFEQLEKQSTKQLQILEKQTKDFLNAITDLVEASKPSEPVPLTPHLLDNLEKIENSIEKEEIPEYNLEDIGRIPNIADLKVKFDDEILGERIEE